MVSGRFRQNALNPGTVVLSRRPFALFAGTVSFWMIPFLNLWSRRFEYQADRYASKIMTAPQLLIGALRKLSERNPGHIMPHPLCSAYCYLHLRLLERGRALNGVFTGK